MSVLTDNTAKLRKILALVKSFGHGEFVPSTNLATSSQTMTIDLGFKPSVVVVFRESWEKGTQSINTAFSSDFNFSICSTASSTKAVEKLVTSSYITKTDSGFTITGNSTYYWVGGVKYIYFALP